MSFPTDIMRLDNGDTPDKPNGHLLLNFQTNLLIPRLWGCKNILWGCKCVLPNYILCNNARLLQILCNTVTICTTCQNTVFTSGCRQFSSSLDWGAAGAFLRDVSVSWLYAYHVVMLICCRYCATQSQYVQRAEAPLSPQNTDNLPHLSVGEL